MSMASIGLLREPARASARQDVPVWHTGVKKLGFLYKYNHSEVAVDGYRNCLENIIVDGRNEESG